MAKEGFDKLTLSELRRKVDVVHRLANLQEMIEVQGDQEDLALVFPARGGREGICALLCDRLVLLKLVREIQSHFGLTVEDRILATLERMERRLEQRKNS